MAVNKWDRSEYERQMNCVKKAANAYSEWIDTGIGNAQVTDLVAWATRIGYGDLLQEGIGGYRKHTVRLHDLYKTMKQYLEDYETVIAGSKGNMENVEEVESAYGSFGTILSGISLSTGTALAASKAYQFAQSGKTFSGDYNDLTEFMNESWGYELANFWHGVSKIGDMKLYSETIRAAGKGEYAPYVTELLQSGIKSMVEGIPASKPYSMTNIDWDAIGQKLGIEGLEERMQPIQKLLEEMSSGKLSKAKIKEFGQRCDVAAAFLKLFGDKTKCLVAVLEGLSEGAGEIEDGAEFAQYASTTIANYFNGYADQITYLDTMKNSLLEMGYWEDSQVMQQIDELRKLYDDRVLKTYEESKDVFLENLDKGVKKVVVEQVPLLKDVTKFWSVVGKTSVLYGNDRVKAAGELMGCMQFDNMLTQTYEHYSNLVESGMATEAEIAEADRLYDMVKALKIKEYKAMQTISKDHDIAWYNLATRKLEELGEVTVYQSHVGSSGGGSSGGGRNG